jgi:hypothetical protein
MNEQIKQLAEKAGFAFWEDEAHNPGDVIDWSSSYDDELVKYTELLLQEVANVLHDEEDRCFDNATMASVAKQCRIAVAEHFNINDQGIIPESVKYETIDLEFSDEELLQYMKMAHELDITFNQLVERALKEVILNARADGFEL